MNIIYIILPTVFLTIIVYEGIKKLYKSIGNYFLTKERFDDQWFVTENKILALERRHTDRFSKVEKRLGIVEVLANDFERDMDRYHTNINKDIDERIKKVNDRLDTAFKRHNKEITDRLTEIERWIVQMDKFLKATNKDSASLRKSVKSIKRGKHVK